MAVTKALFDQLEFDSADRRPRNLSFDGNIIFCCAKISALSLVGVDEVDVPFIDAEKFRILPDSLINVANQDSDLHNAVDSRLTHRDLIRTDIDVDQFGRKS